MRQFIKREIEVDYKSGIYDLLGHLSLSHQKAHANYQNASKDEQLLFLDRFKQILLASDEQNTTLTFDEFSISSKPTSYYGWVEKNTRPRVKTNEKNESAPPDC